MKPIAYYKFEMLSNELKEKHKIKIGATVPRYDCTRFYGNYKGLEAFINKKGMIYFNLHETKDLIKANSKRKTEFVLKGNGLNFSSLYYDNPQIPNICFGYANGKPQLNNGAKNPLFVFRNDLYLILADNEFTQIEVFIFENCKPFAIEYLQECLNGYFEDIFQEIREQSKVFFNY